MTRESIIKAAFRVWGQELYHSTSLSMVAQALGVSKPALYRHFCSKKALLDAMFDCFFDEYADFIRPWYKKALVLEDRQERILMIVRAIVEYYSRNMDAFIFSLIRVFDSREKGVMLKNLEERGLGMRKLWPNLGNNQEYPSLLQLVMASLTFRLAIFHRSRGPEAVMGDREASALSAFVERHITRGLGFGKAAVRGLDFEGLENSLVLGFQAYHEDDGLLRAVAGAVAEAGPWNASMDMVARRSGLSKSGLYAHFKNKEDMIRQFFLTEFDRIAHYAGLSSGGLAGTEERLYLVVLSVAAYLRSYPEILIAMDWFKSRWDNFEPQGLLRIYQVVAGTVSSAGVPKPDESLGMTAEQTSQWVLFLILNTLMLRPDGMDFGALPNSSIRALYQFITLGLEGCLEQGWGPSWRS